MPVEAAAGHVEEWLNQKACRLVTVEPEDVAKALELLRHLGLGGDLTTDAQIAAAALRLDATIHSVDTDFLRFPGLRMSFLFKTGIRPRRRLWHWPNPKGGIPCLHGERRSCRALQ
ncbi:MAG: PIN domain-containing protein [Puniceicoccaceae bacterium]